MIGIIGSQGYVGKKLVSTLKNSGIEVCEFSSKLNNFVDENGLLSSKFKLPENCETVIYLAQSPYYRDFPSKYKELIKVNTMLPFEVARRAIDIGAKKFIYFSTGSVYKQGFNPIKEDSELNRANSYALSKIHAEENLDLLREKIEICCVRPFGIYGPGQKSYLIPNLINSVVEGKDIFINKKSHADEADGLNISLCYIDDVVKIVKEIISKHELPKTLNLASNVSVSIKEIVDEISIKTGLTPNITVQDQLRVGDLIADCSQLENLTNIEFTGFKDGLDAVLNFKEE